jgi:O-antigen/teichoic acid export membrane protein
VTARRGRVARDTAALALGSGVSGVLAYVFFAIVTRVLGAAEAAPVSVLWTYWSLAAAGLTFPVQHWVARSVAAAGTDHVVRRSLPAVTAAVLMICPVLGLASWWARDLLFHRADAWFPVLVMAATIGSAMMGVVRGMLQARERFGSLALGLVLENLVRCAVGLALASTGNHDSVAYGLALIAGYVTCLVWPWTLRMTRRGADHESPLALLGGAAGGQLLSQIVLTGGPVLLALTGGSATEVTVLFAGLALFRAPYTLSLGMVTQLTGRFTVLVAFGRYHALTRVRWALVATTAALALLAAPVGALVGPPLLPLIFGDDVRMPGRLTAVLASGSTVAVAALVATLLLIALGRTLGLVRAWLVGAVAGALVFVLWPAPVLDLTCWTFLLVEVGAFAWMVLEHVRGTATMRPPADAAPVRQRRLSRGRPS